MWHQGQARCNAVRMGDQQEIAPGLALAEVDKLTYIIHPLLRNIKFKPRCCMVPQDIKSNQVCLSTTGKPKNPIVHQKHAETLCIHGKNMAAISRVTAMICHGVPMFPSQSAFAPRLIYTNSRSAKRRRAMAKVSGQVGQTPTVETGIGELGIIALRCSSGKIHHNGAGPTLKVLNKSKTLASHSQ